jgi:hypothetical protein
VDKKQAMSTQNGVKVKTKNETDEKYTENGSSGGKQQNEHTVCK